MKSKFEVSISGPRIVSQSQLASEFTGLKQLHGQYGSVMSETQMSDSRMNLQALFTSSIDDYIPGMKGATLANYVEMKDFIKDDNGKITGAMCVDKESNASF